MTDATFGETTRSLPSTTFSDDAFGELLADKQRRLLLRGLRHADRDRTLAELAREIAAWEADRSVADVPDATVERVHLSLYHNHVPRFVDAGLVEYDSEADAVALTEDGTALGPPPTGDAE